MRKQNGFTIFEVIAGIMVVIILGAIGTYLWHHAYPPNTPAVTQGPMRAGWVTYHSSHSSIQFSYPASWHLNSTLTSQTPSYVLEAITLTGPHDFTMEFELDTDHVNPALSCALTAYVQAAVPLNSQYELVPEGPADKPTMTNIVYLVATNQKNLHLQTGRSCGLGWASNPVTSHSGFNFWGSYGTSYNANPTLTTSDFLSQPEVQTATAIFNSFKQ